MNRIIKAADLFCGAGGTTSGLKKTCKKLNFRLDLLAINHWDLAIATHTKNHPNARHICETLDSILPRKVVPDGNLDIMLASPECIHHSNARGGRPMCDQSRASAWHVLRWAEALRIENILIENIREFLTWGPLRVNGKPLKRKKGQTFNAFISALKSLGYNVEYEVLTAADYGDPTTRKRLFILARRGNKKIIWPETTHSRDGKNGKKKWITARKVIDWSIEGDSIFGRKRPLAPNTIRRIEIGLKRYCRDRLEPFLVMLYKTNNVRSVDRPMPTVMTVPKVGLCRPFLVHFYGKGKTSGVDAPLPTVTCKDRFGLVNPFILQYEHSKKDLLYSVDEPLRTITSSDSWGLVMPQFKGYKLDIKFRMLKPHELAKTMSFDSNYEFSGNRTMQVKQIGNAVPVMVAKSLCESLLAN